MLFAILVYKGFESFFKLEYKWDNKQSVLEKSIMVTTVIYYIYLILEGLLQLTI
ncbi:hypothetical protein HNP21_006152 [Bacillus aryabhattai]|uniref:Uncharacterized protein n=1 Tax=Priestia aryabhattai TaxID=412384 RepID=A0A7W3NHB4_PRIAR|nr:hypothetical protein [Priestia aryabhattai]